MRLKFLQTWITSLLLKISNWNLGYLFTITTSILLSRPITLALLYFELCPFYTYKIVKIKVNFNTIKDIQLKLGILIHHHYLNLTIKAHNPSCPLFWVMPLLYLENRKNSRLKFLQTWISSLLLKTFNWNLVYLFTITTYILPSRRITVAPFELCPFDTYKIM